MIYTITTIEHLKPKYRKDGSSYEYRSMRCVGYLEMFEDAEDAVLKNAVDINEAGYYPYAVIEAVTEGIYSHDLHPVWYEWDSEKEGYKRLDKTPEEFKRIIGFGMG